MEDDFRQEGPPGGRGGAPATGMANGCPNASRQSARWLDEEGTAHVTIRAIMSGFSGHEPSPRGAPTVRIAFDHQDWAVGLGRGIPRGDSGSGAQGRFQFAAAYILYCGDAPCVGSTLPRHEIFLTTSSRCRCPG